MLPKSTTGLYKITTYDLPEVSSLKTKDIKFRNAVQKKKLKILKYYMTVMGIHTSEILETPHENSHIVSYELHLYVSQNNDLNINQIDLIQDLGFKVKFVASTYGYQFSA